MKGGTCCKFHLFFLSLSVNEHAMKYSFIIPVYNRPDEVDELLDSLTRQTIRDFEVVVVEDGSSVPCKEVVDKYADRLTIHYYNKANSGPGQTRNYGVERANGEYMLILEQDMINAPKMICKNVSRKNLFILIKINNYSIKISHTFKVFI